MKSLSHQSAKPSHYSKGAEDYDAFNEANSAEMNDTVEKILREYKVETVLDLTCGTGSQVFWLAKRGYNVVGVDINANMLKIAAAKCRGERAEVKFIKGDMRTSKVGVFDAVVTMFNAVGHLTKRDFEKAMRNVGRNLRDGGLYVFDIFNLNYLTEGDRITTLTIDWQKEKGGTKVREIQYSTIDKSGILASYSTFSSQKGLGKPKLTRSAQTLQIYTAKQLENMLRRNGFTVLRQCGIDGSELFDRETQRILTVAKKT